MRFMDFIRDRARYYNCPACNRGLRDCELRLLQHVGDRYTVKVTCATCHLQFVVILVVQGSEFETVDEAVRERETRSAAPPIQGDEVLDVHLALRDFSGPLTDLFHQPSPGPR